MIRVPLDEVPDVGSAGWASPAHWCDEVRFVRDEYGGWWAKVVRVDRSAPSPHEWTARAAWFGLSEDSDFELALDAWLHDQVGNLEGES
jgi:hypothetical protein